MDYMDWLVCLGAVVFYSAAFIGLIMYEAWYYR